MFVSVPDGYRAVGAFWRSTGDAGSSLDFGLRPTRRVTEFSFVHGSDTHIAPNVAASSLLSKLFARASGKKWNATRRSL